MEDKDMYKNENVLEETSTKYRLARAYIPFQTYMRQFGLMEALIKGTLFPELYRPYDMKR